MIVIALWHAVRRQERPTTKGRFYLTRERNLDVRKFKNTSEFLLSCMNQWTVRVVMSSVRSAQFVSSKLILKFFIFIYFIVFLYTVHTHPRSDSCFTSNFWYDDKALLHRVLFFERSILKFFVFTYLWQRFSVYSCSKRFYEQEQVPSCWKFGLQIRKIRTQRRSVKFLRVQRGLFP